MFDLNVRLEDDDDGDIPLDLNEHEADDGNASFDLNKHVHDEHGNGTTPTSSCLAACTVHNVLLFVAELSCSIFFIGFNLNLPLDEFGAVDFDYVQNLAGKHAYCTMNKLVFSLYLESCREFFVL